MIPNHPSQPGYLFPANADSPAVIREETAYLDLEHDVLSDYRGKKIDLRTGAK